MTSEQIDDLFAQTLLGDHEDDAPWEAVSALRRLGTREIFDRAADWSKSENALQRARGADVLSQLGKTADHPNNSFPEESYEVVSQLLLREKEWLPLASAIAALGHIGNPLVVPMLAGYTHHPSPKVRFDLAFALGCFPNDPGAVEALLVLMQDGDADVRDWATFGLGVLGDSDSTLIRDALFLRLDDDDQDTREEAMVGLGKRKDNRVVKSLIAALDQPSVPSRAIEAAQVMLDRECADEGWSGQMYAAALRQKFAFEAKSGE